MLNLRLCPSPAFRRGALPSTTSSRCVRDALETTIARYATYNEEGLLENENYLVPRPVIFRQYNKTDTGKGQLSRNAFHECDHSGLRFSANAVMPEDIH